MNDFELIQRNQTENAIEAVTAAFVRMHAALNLQEKEYLNRIRVSVDRNIAAIDRTYRFMSGKRNVLKV